MKKQKHEIKIGTLVEIRKTKRMRKFNIAGATGRVKHVGVKTCSVKIDGSTLGVHNSISHNDLKVVTIDASKIVLSPAKMKKIMLQLERHEAFLRRFSPDLYIRPSFYKELLSEMLRHREALTIPDVFHHINFKAYALQSII